MNKTYLIALILGVFGLSLAAYGFLHCNVPVAEPASGSLLDTIRVPGLTEAQVTAMIEQVKAWIGLAVTGIAAGIAGLRHAISKGQAILRAGDKLLVGLQDSLPMQPSVEKLTAELNAIYDIITTHEAEPGNAHQIAAERLLNRYTITRKP